MRGRIATNKVWQNGLADGIFCPNTEKLGRRGLIGAHALVNCRNKYLPVRVINMENHDVTIYKNTVLGSLEPTEAAGYKIRQMTDSERNTRKEIITKLLAHNLNQLNSEDTMRIMQIIDEFSDVFSADKFDIGVTQDAVHTIDTGNQKPISCTPRRIPMHVEGKVDELVEKMVEHEIVRPSSSPWNSPIVVVAKKNGDIRLCVDYRKLNSVTKRPIFPIPEPQQLFDALTGSGYFSTLDLSQGYHQVRLAEQDIPKTAFTTSKGQFEYLRMPFGLCSAPATFQRLMHSVLKADNWEKCLVYLDDILIFGKNPEEHFQRLRSVLSRIREAGLKLSPEKCHLFQQEVEYLGHIISKSGIHTSPAKVEKVQHWPTPTNEDELRSFLGLCGYYRRFIRNYSQVVSCLEKLCLKNWNNKKKKRTQQPEWKWNQDHEKAFQQLKWYLTHSPILAFPTKDGQFILDTDACHDSIGAVLSQIQGGTEKVIAYASNKLTKSEKGYCITRKELLAVYKYVKLFKHYLYGRKFIVRTDHQALVWLLNWRKPNTSQYCTWVAELECYDMEVQHRPGKLHGNADALSRLPQCEQCSLKHLDPKKRRNVKLITDTEDSERVLCRLRNLAEACNQEEDEAIKKVMEMMKKGNTKERRPAELSSASEEVKSFWSKRDRLCIRGQTLFYKVTNGSYALVVPKTRRQHLINTMHQMLGHVGISKTISALKNEYFWPAMEYDIRLTINRCKWCAQRKSGNQAIQPPLMKTMTTFPFEKIAIDITGPLPLTRGGHRYILGVIDYFTKFPMLIPLRNIDSKTVARELVSKWICLFGAPHSIHSDRGTAFEAELFQELCSIFRIQKTKTAPYYPKSDGLVERLFKTIKDMLYSCMKSFQKEWVDVIPFVELGLRSTVQSTIKLSPFETLFGKPMRLPTKWLEPTHETPEKKIIENRRQYSEYISDMQKKLEEIHHKIVAQQKRTQPTDSRSGLMIGSHVMARILPIKKGINEATYDGPYVISRKLGEWTYELTHVKTKKKICRNHHHVKPIEDPSLSIQPQQSNTAITERRQKRARKIPDRYGFFNRGESVVY